MAPPPRTMTDDTFVDEKMSEIPASPTNTDTTLTGDVVIEIEDDARSSIRSSQCTGSSMDIESAQPHNSKKRPEFLRRVTAPFRSEPDPAAVTFTKTRKLDDTPPGFPQLAAFQASETNFSLYRSFSYLHSRVLLDLQDEIRCLECELDEKDWDDHEVDEDRLRSRDYDRSCDVNSETRTRRVIMREIKDKLLEYDEVLIKCRTLESFQKPSDRNYRSVRRYHNNKKPLLDTEMDAIRTKEDIISLTSGREWASFDGGVESGIGRVDQLLKRVFRLEKPPLQRFFRTPELQAKTDDKSITYYSSTRIDKLVNILITLVIFCLLVIPVITMYQLTSTATHTEATTSDSAVSNATISKAVSSSSTGVSDRDTFNAVGVLIVFTLLFSAAMSLLTRAARHELFAASAAYCAILVVFIGNFTGPGN